MTVSAELATTLYAFTLKGDIVRRPRRKAAQPGMGIIQSLTSNTAPQMAGNTDPNLPDVFGPTTGGSNTGNTAPALAAQTAQYPSLPGTFPVPHPPPPGPSRPAPPPPRPSTLSSMVSYFLPISRPDLSHTHTRPTPSDHRLASLYLTHRHLPPELVPRILDEAEQWSVCTREMKRPVRVVAGTFPPRRAINIGARWLNGQEDDDGVKEIIALGGQGGLREDEGDCWILCSEEIGCCERFDPVLDRLEDEEDARRQRGVGEKEKVKENLSTEQAVIGENGQPEVAESRRRQRKGWLRQIEVKTLSKDQGWSSSNQESYGTYDHSYTWFELSLIRDGKQVEGSRLDIQHNVHAGQYFLEHVNTLGPDHNFVKMARPGDRVVLWARAQYAAWQNNVREASISIYTTPFPPCA